MTLSSNRDDRTGTKITILAAKTLVGVEVSENNTQEYYVANAHGIFVTKSEKKCVSLLYLTISTERKCFLNSREPHGVKNELSKFDLWTIIKAAFVRPRKITFITLLLFLRKRKKENLYSNSTEGT